MKQEEPKLLRISKAAYELGLSTKTVRRWVKQEKIQAVWVGKEARIPRSEIERFVGTANSRFLILYGRVSGQGQKDNLKTQLDRLQAWATTERLEQKEYLLVLSDIGSGLKASRKAPHAAANEAFASSKLRRLKGSKNLQKLLKLVVEDRVSEGVVTYADRLTRFGREYLQTLFTSFDVTFTVLESDTAKTPEPEVTDDLLSIITAFSGRLYGLFREITRLAPLSLTQTDNGAIAPTATQSVSQSRRWHALTQTKGTGQVCSDCVECS